MRHTLLPTIEKRALRREYYFRVIIVGCLLFSVAVFVGMVSLLPSYIRAKVTEKDKIGMISSFKDDHEASGATALTEQLKSDGKILVTLAKSGSKERASEAIEEIVAARGNVTLSAFNYVEIGTTTIAITVQGRAPTRESLLAFKGRLESFSADTKVELPVSQLASSINIQFALRITHPIKK